MSDEISFRRLEATDLPLLFRWLNEPGVVRWWEGRDVSWAAVVNDHTGDTWPFEHWVALVGEQPLGWSRCYRAADFEEETYHWRDHLDMASTGAIDYLVGAEEFRGRGLGTVMIRSFVETVVFERHPEWTAAAAGPFAANRASVKALGNAGFRQVAVVPDDVAPCVLMVRAR